MRPSGLRQNVCDLLWRLIVFVEIWLSVGPNAGVRDDYEKLSVGPLCAHLGFVRKGTGRGCHSGVCPESLLVSVPP